MKMLARLTMASAMPARLTGLRSSMRETVPGLHRRRGGGVFSVSMFCPCDFGFFLASAAASAFSLASADDFRDHRAVQSVLVR